MVRINSIFLVILLFLSGCATMPSTAKPPLEHEGEVYVYVEPFSPDAQRLRFQIEHLSVVRSDGTEYPLTLSLPELGRSAGTRQRLLGFGRVAPGHYTALSMTIKQALLLGEGGEAALLTPEGAVKTDFSFEVQQRNAIVITLTLKFPDSVQSGFRFLPVFTPAIPPRPVSGLIGYVTNWDDDSIMVFDKKAGEVAAVMTTGRNPASIVIDPKTGRAYISLFGSDTIEIIDITGNVINTLHLIVNDGPRDLALTPDGKTLLAVNATSRTLSFIDTRSVAELGRVSVGESPRSVLIDRAGKRAYVFNTLSNTITVIDIANRAVVVTLSTDIGPTQGQFNRGGDRLYVIFERGPYLSIIDPASLSIIRKVFVGPGLSFLKVDTTTDMLYVARRQEAQVEMYDPFSLIPGAFIEAMPGISYMTIDGEENSLYLLSAETKMIMSINLISKKKSLIIDVGERPSWITMMGER